MSAPFTPEQEARIMDIALDMAIDVAVAACRAQAQVAANQTLDRYRVSRSEVAEFLSTTVSPAHE